jgi:phage baseplate assembly protein gpV
MQAASLYEIPTPGRTEGCYLAEVVSVQDPENLGRVQVRSLHADGVTDHDGPIWARVAVPYAGNNRGAFFLPDVGDEVLINFLQGDSRFPIVIGGLWNGSDSPPETLGGDRVDRWTLVGTAGTRIAIVEESDATISFTTPGGVSGELKDTGGGTIEFVAAGTTITVDSSGVSIQTPSKVSVSASQVEVSAGQVSVSAAVSTFSGIVTCDVLQATTVIASTYTPGAGNIW